MTKWRTQKLAFISALWMLFAFAMPMASPVCAVVATSSPCAQMATTTTQSTAPTSRCSSHQSSRAVCAISVAVQSAMCCCEDSSSLPQIAAFANVNTHRVLDVASNSDSVVIKPFTWVESKVFVRFQSEERSRRLCSLRHSPPSGRAPPVVLS